MAENAKPGLTDSSGNPVDLTTDHPIYKLAAVVSKAWTDEDFKRKLLTYPDIHEYRDWVERSSPDYSKSSNALETLGVRYEKPVVVLTCPQFKWGYQKVEDEMVLVLPTPLPLFRHSVGGARIAMTFCPAGM